MSGIAGIYHIDGSALDISQLNRMATAMEHRGGRSRVWFDGSIGLAHCQSYSTSEALRENQPLFNSEETCVITCDGRIDNWDELLDELESQGIRLKEPTDGELFLAAYQVWGVDCPLKIKGDFAFAVWDAERQRLFCARDSFSVRPFFYHFDGRRFLFGSQTRQILLNPSVSQDLDDAFVFAFLCGYIWNSEATIYKQVRRLPGGCYLIVQATGVQVQRYWEFNPSEEIYYADEREYEEHYRYLFRKAVRSRLRSVGPVGISVSGGLDSSSVTCVANQIQKEEGLPTDGIQLFTKGHDSPWCDEREYAYKVAEACKLGITTIPANNYLPYDGLIQQSLTFDEPSPSAIFYKLQDALAAAGKSQNVRVMLWGHGADDCLEGSLSYLVGYLRRFQLFPLFRDLRQWHRRLGLGYRSLIREYLLKPLVYPRLWMEKYRQPPWVDHKMWCRHTTPPVEQTGYFSQIVNPAVREWYEFVRLYNPPFAWLDTHIFLQHGIENRYPYFDRDIVEFLLRVPVYQKLHPEIPKFFSTRAFQGIVPDSILNRRDGINPSGFVIEALRHEWMEIREALNPPPQTLEHYIDIPVFFHYLTRVRHGEPHYEHAVSTALVFALWLRGTA